MCFQRVRQATPRLAAGAVAAMAVAVAACGGSSPAKPPAANATSPSVAGSAVSSSGGPMPTAGTAAQSAVQAAWQEFFNAKTPTARRVVLLQNGHTFTQVLAAQARLQSAASVTAKVDKVTLVSPTQAKVTYTLLLAGQPTLSNQAGVAVYQDGRWKVGLTSFCGLLVMEGGTQPAACSNGG